MEFRNFVKFFLILFVNKLTLLYNTFGFGGFYEDKLTKEEVLHVLDLARLDATDEEIEKYQVELYKCQLKQIRLKNLNDFDEDLLIAPWSNNATFRENGLNIPTGDILLNVPNKKGNFISVDVEVVKSE